MGQSLPKWKVNDVLKFADTSTVPVVINFWASWCRPCVEELPWFQKMVPDYKHKNVKLVLVSLDYPEDYPKAILAFAKKHRLTADLVWFDEQDANYFCPAISPAWEGNIPVTLMVNNAKKYRFFYGRSLSEELLGYALDKLVE